MKLCLNCNNKFEESYESQLYCQKLCKRRAREKRVYLKIKQIKFDEVIKITKKCIICKSEFTSSSLLHKYCSGKCRSKYKPKMSIELNCKWCEKPFVTHSKIVKYCSNSCLRMRNKDYYKKSETKIKPNKRRLIIQSIGGCESCGFKHEFSLNLHHINSIGRDNHKDNLMVLCSNCHNIYHGYVGRNKKSEGQTREFVLKSIKASFDNPRHLN